MPMFEEGLGRREANYVPLTPIDFIARAADVYGERSAIVRGDARGPLSHVECSVRPSRITAAGYPCRPCATRMIERRSFTIASDQPAFSQRCVC